METINNTVINSVMKWICAAVLSLCTSTNAWAWSVTFTHPTFTGCAQKAGNVTSIASDADNLKLYYTISDGYDPDEGTTITVKTGYGTFTSDSWGNHYGYTWADEGAGVYSLTIYNSSVKWWTGGSSDAYMQISIVVALGCTQYDIIADNTGSGSVSVKSKACEDDVVTFTATAGTGYQYGGANIVGDNTDISLGAGDTKSFTMPDEDVILYVTFSAKSYDVTLNPNGGSGSNQTVTATYDAAMPTTLKGGGAIVIPTKTGYNFGGWYSTSAATGGTQYYSYTSSTLASAHTWDKANSTTVLYARWSAKETLITLNKNGGYEDGAAQVTYDGTSLDDIDHATTNATGYHLEGYYTNDATPVKVLNDDGSFAASNVTGYVTSGKWSNASAEITLYAHWAVDVYDIIYKDGGNTDFSGDHESGYPTTHTYGSSTTLNDATKTGYTFGGWYDNSSCTGDEVETLGSTDYTDDITLYAKWTAKVITLTLDDNGGTSDGGGSVTFDGTSATISTDPVYGTKTIAGYYAEEGTTTKVLEADGSFAATDVTGYITSGKWSYSTATSLTLYTKWVTDNKVVTFNLHGHGGDNFTQNVENGQKAIRPADPTDVDYNFDDWYTDDGGEPTNTKFDFANTTISAATTIHAKWTAKTYGDLFFACADISVACHDDGKTYITSSYHETSSVDDGVNIIGSRPIKVTVTGAIPGHVVDITSTGGLKFYKKVDGVYKDLSTNKLTAPLDGQEVYVSYKPTSAGTGEILTPTFTIKCDGHSQAFNGSGEYVKVRNLPATVAIVAKVGNTWHALSANITKSSTPLDEQIFTSIEDGEEGDVLTAHGSASELGYKLWPVKTTSGSADRFGTGSGASVAYGDRLRFAGKSDKALWANDLGESSSSKYNINNYAVVDAIDDDPAAPYEWKVTTTEVGGEFVYTLQTDQTNNTRYLRMYNGRWGTYLDEKGVNELYILPLIDTRLVDMEEYEWGTTSLAVTYTPGATPVALTKVVIGETTINAPTATLTNKGGDVWVLGGLCDLTAKPAEPMVVWLTENGSAKQAMLQVPFIVTSAKTEQNLRTSVSNDSKIYRHVDVIIRNGGTLTTEYDLGNFADLYIYPGGKAIVTNNMSFGAIHMRGGYSVLDNKATYKYPDLCIKSGTITTDSLTYDMFIDNRLYYMFSVPYDVALAGVTDEAGYDDFPVWVKHYNGAIRASGHQVSGWEWYGDVPAQSDFKAGVGYEITAKPKTSGRPLAIIRFPVKSGNIESDEDNTASVSVSNYGYSAYQAGTQSANNVGWNFLGNPYLTEYKSTTSNSMMVQGDLVPHGDPWDGTYEWDETTVRYITVPYDMINDYHHEDVTDYTIPAFSTFFIQYTASASGTFVMGGTRTQASMPALRATQQSRPEVKLDVLLSGEGENEEGKTGLVIHDQYDGGYKDFEDVEQWFVGDGAQKTYTFASGIAVAYNLMDEDAASQLIPMGYIATVAGEHTYSLNENNDVSQVDHLWLTDYVSGTTTDLLLQDYTFTTESGRNDSRFALTVVFKQEGVYTDIDSAVGRDRETTRKFIYRDKMYILREGIIYDATGKRVREINK